jgi:hypothetical protein
MNMPLPLNSELSGTRCAAAFVDGAIEKTTFTAFDPATADLLVTDLRTYADQLEASPLTTARLLDARTQPGADGRRTVWHRQEYVDGLTLAELPAEERVIATRQALGEIAAMPTLRGGRLATPIDAWSGNFRVSSEGVAHFVDFMPPMVRDGKGKFEAAGVPPFERAAVGFQTLAMARLVQSVASGKEAYDMLPDTLRGTQRDALRLTMAGNHLAYRLVRKAARIVQ